MTTDTERLDFMINRKLMVSPNDFGEYQVFDPFAKDWDGIVTRNAFHTSARDAIDYAMQWGTWGKAEIEEVPDSAD